VIDFHTHIFPEKIAGKTIPYLAGIVKKGPYTNGMQDGILKSTENAGLTCSVLLPVATSPHQFDSINRFAMQFREGKLLSLGSIHPDNEDYKNKLNFLKEEGFKGIKLHPDYQNTYFNDIRYKRIIGYATELDMIVVVHGGMDPLSPENIHNTPKMSAEVLDDVKPTKLVLAHMGGHAMFDDVERYLVGREVYFDTAVILDTIDKEQFMRITRNHGADKILFGSDSPWADQSQYVELLKNLPLSEVERNAIFHENAEKLLFKNN